MSTRITKEDQREFLSGVFPFVHVAVQVAKSVEPAPGEIIVVGESENAHAAAVQLAGVFAAMQQPLVVDDQGLPDLDAAIVVAPSVDALPKEAFQKASAIIALENDFFTATALVDICENGSIYEIMGLTNAEGLAWIRGEGLTRFSMGW